MTINRLLAKIAMLLLLCVLFTQTAFSQSKTITGTVTDDKGAPLVGANVTAKGTKVGTTTDASGGFKITMPATSSTLTISSIGFTSQDIRITDQNSVQVTLATSQSNLNEVVVIGYGTVRRKDATGALTTVSSKDFNTGVITSPDQLMANKVSGLEVVNNSGQPGSATTIKIRGNGDVQGNGNPLYVIDGVLLDGRNARPGVNLATGGFGQTPDENPLLYINPYDIADITILKDASSTAIYGSRGANGVVVITTKKGSSGPTKLEAGISEGWNVGYMKKYDILSASQYRSALKKYDLDTAVVNPLDHGASVDALKAITQHSTIQNYNVAISGGNETGKFRASFLASKTPGFIKSNELDKYIGTFSGAYKFLEQRLSFDFSLIAAHTNENVVLVSNTAGSQGNLISSALQWNPTQTFTDASGNYIYPSNGSGNPLALIQAYNDLAKVNTFLGSVSASYKILKNLEYKLLYSINESSGSRGTNIDGFPQGISPITGAGLGIVSDAELISQVTDNTLNFNTDLARDLHFTALAGYEYWKSDYNNNSFGAQGFNFNLSQNNLLPIKYSDVLQDGNSQVLPSTFKDITTEVQSFFGRVEFHYLDKYHLTATMRADGSNKFGANNKYGYFPSFGAKWTISNEDFMRDSKVISNFALRGTWGITGSQDFPSGAAIDQFTFNSYNNATQANVGNANLKWESTKQYDIGIDFAFLNNRISGTVDYYNKDKTNILFESTPIQPAPLANEWLNIPGHLMNTGFEFSAGATLVKTAKFSWDLSFNFAYNHNILKKFYAAGTEIPTVINTGQINGQGVSGTLGQIITNNQPVDEFFLKKFTGFDQTGSQQIGATAGFAGDPNPHTLFGGSTTLTYSKFVLTINGGGSGGFLIYNNTATSVTNLSGLIQGRNTDRNAFNSQEKPTDGVAVAASTRFLEPGNFFKLRNATLRYNLGNAGSYLKNVSIFVSGSNLFVITKFSGFDPEVNIDKNNGGYPSRSIEYIPYPTPRSIVAGLNFTL
jgi:TonB-dependent starch-binding outer membrane protein SusC